MDRGITGRELGLEIKRLEKTLKNYYEIKKFQRLIKNELSK